MLNRQKPTTLSGISIPSSQLTDKIVSVKVNDQDKTNVTNKIFGLTRRFVRSLSYYYEFFHTNTGFSNRSPAATAMKPHISVSLSLPTITAGSVTKDEPPVVTKQTHLSMPFSRPIGASVAFKTKHFPNGNQTGAGNLLRGLTQRFVWSLSY